MTAAPSFEGLTCRNGNEVNTEGHPWAEWKRGKTITTTGLARLLAAFAIVPGNIRLPGGQVAKGYQLVHFDDAFERYV